MKISSVIFHRTFEKSYTKLTVEVKKTFKERRNLLLIDPAHPTLHNHPLHGNKKGLWSMNVTGDVRAIYILEGKTAIFIEIGSHSQLY